MNVAIVCMDSQGGIQPYLGLALGLRREGYDVRLVVPSNAVALAAEWQLDARPLSIDIQQLLQGANLAAGGRTGTRAMRGTLAAGLGRWTAEAHAATAGVDLVMAGAGGLDVGRSVAEAHGVPFLETFLQPVGSITGAFPGVFAPNVPRWLGAPGRWVSHILTNALLSVPTRPVVRRVRVETLGLPAGYPKRDRRAPVLYGFSPRVIPTPPSWNGRRFATGYWTTPLPEGWSPPPGLGKFLAAGTPPICFGFGSMPADNPTALAELLVAAARRVGQRALLLSGWGGLEIASADDVYVADAVPHAWLFPRVAVAVHHGGAGTTGAALSAGIPAVVDPHGADQPFWGTRVVELGVGPRPIPRKLLTAPRLADALDRALTDATMRTRAATLGEQLRAEDGVGAAVALIAGYLQRPGLEHAVASN